MKFFLGTHHPHWLADARFERRPLFVSRRSLSRQKSLPRAVTTWALDSGGFTELTMHGRWTVSPADYVDEVRRYAREIGRLAWAAPQDWMCEPAIRERTGMSVDAHQARTVENFSELRALAPDVPWIPVLQGWGVGDYHRCADMYAAAGVDLASEPLVGLGTVCRRQATTTAAVIVGTLAACGIRLHGFGFKLTGLRAVGHKLESADSLAWSYNARREPPLPGHDSPGPGRPRGHINCANCAEFAIDWVESNGLAEAA